MLEALPLHENHQYLDECAEILNEEWPRSKGARCHSLQKSSGRLPYNIVLIDRSDDPPTVIGHSRLSKVFGKDDACFVESVVVKKSLRGKGYGGKLMKETEKHALQMGYKTVYLTTHDQQDFYSHIGYENCGPIVSLGGASTLLSQEQFAKLLGGASGAERPTEICTSASGSPSLKHKHRKDREVDRIYSIPAEETLSPEESSGYPSPEESPPFTPSKPLPPPPPPPHLPPAPVRPLPPPPIPPRSSSLVTEGPITKAEPGKISWMKKELESS